MQEDVLDRIREQYGGMSKGHKKIASFILEHYDQAVFMTAARLGDALRISESTLCGRNRLQRVSGVSESPGGLCAD